jgi:hypothetical protein
MVTDTVYTDFDVIPGTKYFYAYKTVRTNFTESSFSKVVAATPYTAAKGDANGDLAVNVSDIISTVSYILMKNPQPFIFEAADYNSDGVVNVLDITGIVKKILNPGKSDFISTTESATLFLRNDTLFVDTPVALGGIQFTVRNTKTTDYEVLEALLPFERATISNSDSLFFLAYSMTGKTFGPGAVPLLKFDNTILDIENIVLASGNGNTVKAEFKGNSGTTSVTEIADVIAGTLKAQPNPFKGETIISYEVPLNAQKLTFSIYNPTGTRVDEIILKNIEAGENQFRYRSQLNQGIYILRMTSTIKGRVIPACSIKLIVR